MAAIAERLQKARAAGRKNKAIAEGNPPAHWNQVLSDHGQRVLSSREIRVLRLPGRSSRGSPVVCYVKDSETGHFYRHGSVVGHNLIAVHTPKCLHRPLWDLEWEPLVFKKCPDCGLLFGGCIDVSPSAAFEHVFNDPDAEWGMKKGRRSGSWKDARHAKVYHKHEDALPGSISEYTSYVGSGFEAPRFPEHWTPAQVDGGIAPEIDQRRREAAYRYELQNAPYRAPHKKVVELRDAGLDIDRIARKLKVSPSTIDNRLREVPETAPSVDMRALRAKAGGGYSRPQRFRRAEPRDGNERGTSLGSRRTPRITAGNYKHSLEDGWMEGNYETEATVR